VNKNQLNTIANSFGWTNLQCATITSGLINHTWKIMADQGVFVLQRINTSIFTAPEKIDANIGMIADYLAKKSPDYLFTVPVKTIDDHRLVTLNDEVYRAFNYVPNSNTINVVANAIEAKEAAKTFALFTKSLIDFPINQLEITIPNFHQLDLRYHQFEKAVQSNNSDRFNQSRTIIHALEKQKNIVTQFNQYISNPSAYKRVMHHDTKISNVLFDSTGKGICVIDLDTVMPGFLFSDVGDMFRTYISPVSEEEKNLDKIEVRKDFVNAIFEGYTNALKNELSAFELDHFYLCGEILIYMQAIRFITDYLENDIYYGKKYPDHNLVRALNQFRLLELFQEAIN
jgi:Ser/Thr protein kinase RdoA (MazF antagonist)